MLLISYLVLCLAICCLLNVKTSNIPALDTGEYIQQFGVNRYILLQIKYTKTYYIAQRRRNYIPYFVVNYNVKEPEGKIYIYIYIYVYIFFFFLNIYILLPLLSCFSRVQLCDPIDGSPPGSPVARILQARTLEWVAISFSINIHL